jgi:hypothetical protein
MCWRVTLDNSKMLPVLGFKKKHILHSMWPPVLLAMYSAMVANQARVSSLQRKRATFKNCATIEL